MSNIRQSLAATAILAAVTFLAASGAHAQTCNPGIGPAYLAHQAQYDKVVAAVVPQLTNLNTDLNAVGSGASFAINQALYAALVTRARAIVNAINTPANVCGRVLITLPDGTTVVDTSKTDAPACDTTAAACAGWNGFPVPPPAGCMCTGQQNSYGHFLRKSVNENHQSRIAIFDAQEWPCGIGLETKFSSTTNQDESYVAIRLASPVLGGHLDNTGTVRGSLRN
jgi:hypothetical protein